MFVHFQQFVCRFVAGKMSRMLAAKASLATRVDALGEDGTFDLGVEHRAKLEARLRILEEGNLKRISGTGKVKAKFEKYHSTSEFVQYPAAADSTVPSKRKFSEVDDEEKPGETSVADVAEVAAEPKKKKKKVKEETADESQEVSIKQEEGEESTTKKKKKKKNKQEKEVIESESMEVEASTSETPKSEYY